MIPGASSLARLMVVGRRTGLIAGPMALLAVFLVPAPQGLPVDGWRVAGFAIWMAAWWCTEAVPLAITGLLPIVVLPVLGAGHVSHVTQTYANPIAFLVLGAFMIVRAVE